MTNHKNIALSQPSHVHSVVSKQIIQYSKPKKNVHTCNTWDETCVWSDFFALKSSLGRRGPNSSERTQTYRIKLQPRMRPGKKIIFTSILCFLNLLCSDVKPFQATFFYKMLLSPTEVFDQLKWRFIHEKKLKLQVSTKDNYLKCQIKWSRQ